MVNTSSFGRIGIATLLVASIAAGGLLVPVVSTATTGSTDGGDTRDGATEIDTPSTVTDSITPNDVDWYAVELEAGRGFSSQLRPDSDSDALKLTLYNPDGSPVQSATGSDDRATSGMVVERSGTYYVKVAIADSMRTGSVSYRLSVAAPRLDRYDPNERRSQAVSVTPGRQVNGVMTGYDREYFAVNGAAGDTLRVETTAHGGSIDRVVVFGPDGRRIHSSSGKNVRGIGLPKDGTYTIQLVSDLGLTESIDYSLRASTTSGGTTETRRSGAGSHRITPGQTVRGTVGATANTYTVDLTKGEGVTVSLTHETPGDHDGSLSFSIAGPDGIEVGTIPAQSGGAYETSNGTNTAVGGTVATQSGPYTISVSGASNTDYSLSVETDRLDSHDPNERPPTATTLEPNTTMAGVLTGYDRDVYAIDLRAGRTVTIASTSRGGLESAMWVAGPNTTSRSHSGRAYSFGSDTISGTTVGNNLTFTTNQSGTYYIKVVPHPAASTPAAFFDSASYKLLATVSHRVTMLNVSTAESKTITPSTATVMNTTAGTRNDSPTTSNTTVASRSATSSTSLPVTDDPKIGVGLGAFAAIGSVVVVFVSVGAIEWWRQSRDQW